MANLMITVAYNGTNYVGWQRQSLPNAYNRSIQGELEQALKRALKEEITLHGAGRTDAGVHAAGQTASFRTRANIPPENLPMAVNGYLPQDIRIVGCQAMEDEWHARFNAIGKRSCYYLAEQGKPTAFDWQRLAYPRRKLCFEKIRHAASLFEGEHNFQRFCVTGNPVRDYKREVYYCSFAPCGIEGSGFPWQTRQHIWRLTVIGNGFLYKMVRLMMGCLLDIGAGRLQEQDILTAFQEPGGVIAPPAPACGLFMEEVFYDQHRLTNCVLECQEQDDW